MCCGRRTGYFFPRPSGGPPPLSRAPREHGAARRAGYSIRRRRRPHARGFTRIRLVPTLRTAPLRGPPRSVAPRPSVSRVTKPSAISARYSQPCYTSATCDSKVRTRAVATRRRPWRSCGARRSRPPPRCSGSNHADSPRPSASASSLWMARRSRAHEARTNRTARRARSRRDCTRCSSAGWCGGRTERSRRASACRSQRRASPSSTSSASSRLRVTRSSSCASTMRTRRCSSSSTRRPSRRAPMSASPRE